MFESFIEILDSSEQLKYLFVILSVLVFIIFPLLLALKVTKKREVVQNDLKQTGIEVKAKIRKITFGRYGRGQAIFYYMIYCVYTDKEKNEFHVFNSYGFHNDLRQHFFGKKSIFLFYFRNVTKELTDKLYGQEISVYVDKDNWDNYFVDVGKWLGEDVKYHMMIKRGYYKF